MDENNADTEEISEETSEETNEEINEETNESAGEDNNEESSVMSVISQLSEQLKGLQSEITSMKSDVANFIELGGVVREGNIDIEDSETEEEKFVPIEELDLNL